MRKINHSILAILLTGVMCASAQNANWDSRFATNGPDSVVRALAVSGSNVYVGGYFTNAGGLTANGIARWDGNSWSALGTGLTWGSSRGTVNAIAVRGTNVYVGGHFDRAGGIQVANFAIWDGVQWHAMDYGFNDEVYAIAIEPNSPRFFVGGAFTKAGNELNTPIPGHLAVGPSYWAAYGGSGNIGEQAVLSLAAGGACLYAGTDSGYRIIGNDNYDLGFPYGPTVVRAFQRGYSTIVYEALRTGEFHQKHGPIQFRSSGLGISINDFALTGDELYVAGFFVQIRTNASPNDVLVNANRIARFYNNTWSALGSGLDGGVNAIAANGNNIYVGGSFLNAGGKSSPYFAIWHAPPVDPRFTSVGLTAEGNPKLTILGRNGLDCRVEWSSTLTNWTPLATTPNPEGELNVTDTTAAGVSSRFYRVVQP